MKKSTFVIIVTGFLMLSGCSSSGGSGDSNNAVDRPEPVDPEFGLLIPSIPDIDNSPEWGLDVGNAPDRLPPIWGGPEEMPPIDNSPVANYTVLGNTITDADGNTFIITDVDWKGEIMMVQDAEGNEYSVEILRQGENKGDFLVFFNGEGVIIGSDAVQGGPRPLMESGDHAIDRDAIRDSIRARLK